MLGLSLATIAGQGTTSGLPRPPDLEARLTDNDYARRINGAARPDLGDNRDRYARAALERECAAVANAPAGDRNRTLNLAAWSLARLEALTSREIEDGLLEAAAAAGMPAGEALRTVQSGLSRRRAA